MTRKLRSCFKCFIIHEDGVKKGKKKQNKKQNKKKLKEGAQDVNGRNENKVRKSNDFAQPLHNVLTHMVRYSLTRWQKSIETSRNQSVALFMSFISEKKREKMSGTRISGQMFWGMIIKSNSNTIIALVDT